MSEQCYLFTVPGDELVWCEMFTSDDHFVAPTPFVSLVTAAARLGCYPGMVVDTLSCREEIEAAREWARVCPSEIRL